MTSPTRNSLLYRFRSGKNSKWKYYCRGYLRQLVPAVCSRRHGERLLRMMRQRADWDYIRQRIDYCCALTAPCALPADAPTLSAWRIPKKRKVYYFDSQEFTRCFHPDLHWLILPGDIIHTPQYPSIVKSRPLGANNANGVLFKMDKIRHFIFVNDPTPFMAKQPTAIFRGKVSGKQERIAFMQRYFGSAVCNCGDVSQDPAMPTAWQTPKLTINDHLQYRYIMALEGNDVASNLKWIMSSNSIAVMPRPTCETWFMEGTLIPNYHYIEIKSDFSDLEEKIQYYNTHMAEAETIIEHAHQYIEQFKDTKREEMIAMGVMDKYLRLTNTL